MHCRIQNTLVLRCIAPIIVSCRYSDIAYHLKKNDKPGAVNNENHWNLPFICHEISPSCPRWRPVDTRQVMRWLGNVQGRAVRGKSVCRGGICGSPMRNPGVNSQWVCNQNEDHVRWIRNSENVTNKNKQERPCDRLTFDQSSCVAWLHTSNINISSFYHILFLAGSQEPRRKQTE